MLPGVRPSIFFRVRADRTDFFGRRVDSDNTGLAQDDALVFCEHERVCSAKIDSDVV